MLCVDPILVYTTTRPTMRVVIACPTQINHRICVWMCALVYLYSLNFCWHCNVPHNRIQRTARNEKEAAEAAVRVTGVKTTSPMWINTANRAYQAPYCYQLNCLTPFTESNAPRVIVVCHAKRTFHGHRNTQTYLHWNGTGKRFSDAAVFYLYCHL